MYWKTDKIFQTFFNKYMSRDRFLLILRCLHIAKDDNRATDRLYKIRPTIDYFNRKMLNIYSLSKELSLDESMVLWRGHLVLQYIKNKQHTYGMKLYILTEPKGLVLKLCVYAGQWMHIRWRAHTKGSVALAGRKSYEPYSNVILSVFLDKLLKKRV